MRFQQTQASAPAKADVLPCVWKTEDKMRVNTYDEDGNLMGECLWLRDVFGDDDGEYETALAELNKTGRYHFGGGAAPYVLIMRRNH